MPAMNFTIERVNNKINLLDITVSKENNNVSFDIFDIYIYIYIYIHTYIHTYIYRKPTANDTIIREVSCHPTEHKLAAIRYLTNRNETCILNENNKQRENEIMGHILRNNENDISTVNKRKRIDNKKNQKQTDKTKSGKNSHT
jgi:hypothetical protein